jgi:hypothetical protein
MPVTPRQRLVSFPTPPAALSQAARYQGAQSFPRSQNLRNSPSGSQNPARHAGQAEPGAVTDTQVKTRGPYHPRLPGVKRKLEWSDLADAVRYRNANPPRLQFVGAASPEELIPASAGEPPDAAEIVTTPGPGAWTYPRSIPNAIFMPAFYPQTNPYSEEACPEERACTAVSPRRLGCPPPDRGTGSLPCFQPHWSVSCARAAGGEPLPSGILGHSCTPARFAETLNEPCLEIRRSATNAQNSASAPVP